MIRQSNLYNLKPGLLLLWLAAGGAMAQVHPSLRAAVADPQRPDADREQDVNRKPAEVLAFFGLQPGMTVLDLFAGGGYFTEILDRAVGQDGKVYAQTNDAYISFIGPAYEKRFEGGRLPRVERVRCELNDLKLPEGSLDMVLMSLVWHDVYYEDQGWPAVDREAVLAHLYKALKPGGVIGLIEASAEPGSGHRDTKTLHRVDEALIKKEFKAAGFRLDGESNMLRNPDDDPSIIVFDKKIRGRTDRFVLRFRKP